MALQVPLSLSLSLSLSPLDDFLSTFAHTQTNHPRNNSYLNWFCVTLLFMLFLYFLLFSFFSLSHFSVTNTMNLLAHRQRQVIYWLHHRHPYQDLHQVTVQVVVPFLVVSMEMLYFEMNKENRNLSLVYFKIKSIFVKGHTLNTHSHTQTYTQLAHSGFLTFSFLVFHLPTHI